MAYLLAMIRCCRWTILFCLCGCFLLIGCEDSSTGNDTTATLPVSNELLQVYAVNAPLAWMAQEIGGELVQVHMPIGGGDPAFWQPVAEDILPWQGADLILRNGAGYAAWMDYASLPRARIVDTSKDLEGEFLPRESAATPHSHGPEGDHSHGPLAFTLWLDMALAAQQAEAVLKALQAAIPAETANLDRGYSTLRQQLSYWDSLLVEAASGLSGRTLIYSHPVYQYFSRRYALPGSSLHWEPDVEPSGEQWQGLEQLLSGAEAPLMIWEAEPLAAVRSRLESLGVEVVVVEPGAAAQDFQKTMEANLRRLGGRPQASPGR